MEKMEVKVRVMNILTQKTARRIYITNGKKGGGGKGNPNYPSKTRNPSGKGRGNTPKKSR